MITLKELCEAANVSRRAIQGYEKEGLIKASGKNQMGYLLYEEEVISTVETIRLYQDMGFKVKEIMALESMNETEAKGILVKRKTQLEADITRKERALKEIEKLIEEI